MATHVCATCGIDLDALSRRETSRFMRDPVGVIMEFSIWAAKRNRALAPTRRELRRRGMLHGRWWDEMSCTERTLFLQTHLRPDGFRILFPEPVLTWVTHTDWEGLNKDMRKKLDYLQA